MANYNQNPSDPSSVHKRGDPNRTGQILGGLFIVGIGLVLLARQMGVYIPRWIFSFETILIAVGIYIGLRHSFRGVAWLIPTLIGVFLLLDDFYPEFDFYDFFWPMVIIGVGLFIMYGATKKKADWKKWNADNPISEDSSEELLDSTVIFGGAKKNIITKNFRGGEAVTVFGGTEINLMQADLTGPVVLELTQVFGGTKLIVPPHWKVWSKEMVAILGGIDDKRPMMGNQTEETNKVLILRGTCVLGGIDIRSY